MKIAIDIQTTLGQPTGFGFYVSNLTRELRKISGEDKIPDPDHFASALGESPTLSPRVEDDENGKDCHAPTKSVGTRNDTKRGYRASGTPLRPSGCAGQAVPAAAFEFELIRPKSEVDFSTPKRFIWDQLTLPLLAMKRKANLLHQPCFSAPFIFRGPVVVTVNDIISILFPENIPFASRMFYSKWMPFSYRKAARIIAISESTKTDIMRVLKIPEGKIAVIPLAVDERFAAEIKPTEITRVKDKYAIAGDYILHVGTLEPRKNLDFLIGVFEKLRKIDGCRNLKLVIAGKKGWYYEGLFEKVRRLHLEAAVVFTGYVDDGDKPALYRGASVFAFPSLYEGFGLPPLEAITSGVPVVSSNTSSLPEVVGEAGILLSPKDEKGWVEALGNVYRDSDLSAQMKVKNKDQSRKFSWEKTARMTIAVYREAMNVSSKLKTNNS